MPTYMGIQSQESGNTPVYSSLDTLLINPVPMVSAGQYRMNVVATEVSWGLRGCIFKLVANNSAIHHLCTSFPFYFNTKALVFGKPY